MFGVVGRMCLCRRLACGVILIGLSSGGICGRADDLVSTLSLDPDPSPFFSAIGSATSQGVSVLKADQARSIFGVTGAGVKLGVISDSFNGSGSSPTVAAQIAAGNLPGSDNPNGYTTGVTVVKDDTGTDEGRAMLEIVHDVAPGAQLYFHSAFNNTAVPSYSNAATATPDQTIADAITGLAGVSGMRVIVDDVGILTAARFQDGAAARAASAAYGNGIAYFSAAGNSATNATRVTTTAGVSGTVNWGTDNLLLMRIGANSSASAVLQWGEPYPSISGSAATSNFIVAATTTNGAATYFTVDNQRAGEDPYEFLTVTNGGTSSLDFAFKVTRGSGTAPVLMQLTTYGNMAIIDADKTNAPTISGQAAAVGAVGVAASYWGTPTTVETFSSRGPTLILYDAAGNPINQTRSSPLLTAPDGGTTTTSGFTSFFGTSAAAPHAAAVAALVMERFDQKGLSYSTQDVYQVLYDSAVDIGTAGFDTTSGYGRIDALAAVSAGRIWDGNGSSAGVSGTGSWSQAKWTLEAAGDKPTGKFIRGQQAIFGSGTAAQAAYAIAVDGNYDVAGLQFARDTVTLAGGSGSLRLTSPTVDVASGLTATVAAALTGTGGLQKTGAGTLKLTGSAGYTGGTTISAGTLYANGNLAASGPVSVTAYATLAGSGTVGAVTLATNATIAPGNSPGTLTTADVIFGAGGNYNWQMTSATGTAGLQWDFITSSGSLTVNATVGNAFAINVWTLSGTGPDVNGPAANFNQLSNYTWKIGSFAGGITGFASNLFSIVTGSANGTAGFANAFLGTFSLTTLGNDLNLVYAAPAVQNYDYVGGTGSFTTGSNWAGGSAPSGYGTINFAGPGGTATNDLVTLVNGLSFSGTAGGGYVVAGNAMSVGSGGVVNNSGLAQTVLVPLALTSSGTVAANAGSVTLSGGFDTGGFGVAVAGSGDTTIASLAGAGGLVKNGNGTLTLSGSNSYTGGTTLNAGRVVAGSPAALGSATNALILNGGTLDTGVVDLAVGVLSGSAGAVITTGSAAGARTLTTTVSSGTSTFAGALADSAAGRFGLAKSGSGTLVLSGSSSATGGITLNAGTLQVGGVAGLGGTATPVAVNGGTLNTGTLSISIGALSGSAGAIVTTATTAGTRTLTTTIATGTSIFAGTIANSGPGVMALSKLGGGTLVIGGSNANTGTTTIAAGTLAIGSGSTSGRLGSGPIVNNGVLAFNRSDAYGGTVTNLISGSGALILSGGTLTLTGVNSSTGGTTIDGGSLQIGHVQALGGTSNALTLNAGTLNTGTFSPSLGTLGGAGGVITTSTAPGTRTFTTTVASGSTSVFAGSLQNSGSGVMALTKAGGGTLVLTGSSSATGVLTIASGTVRIGDGGTAGSVATTTIAMSSGSAAVVFDRDDNITFAGSVGPSGRLVKDGAGTLTLSGFAFGSFDGTTPAPSVTIASGTLQVGVGGTTGYLLPSIPVVNQAALAFNRADAVFYSGTMSGAGSLVKMAAGTLTVSASNSFSGGTIIREGTLVVGNPWALGSGSGALVLSGGTLDTGTFSVAVGPLSGPAGGVITTATTAGTRTLTTNVGSGTSLFAGSIQNSGSGVMALTKAGGGTLVVTGSHGYTGVTTISAGTLQVGDGGTSGAIGSGPVTNNGTLVFNRSDDYGGAFAGAINGSGGVRVQGGAVTLTGSNGFAGATTIAGGTLQVGNGGTAGRIVSGTIANNGALVFNRSDAYGGALASVITGTGSLTLSGGALTLTAASPLSGPTAINAGALQVNGSLASSAVAVNAGGQLGGSGAVGGLTVNAGGTLMPGASPGTLTARDVVFNGGGSYNWQLSNATGTAGLQWDFLNSSGSLTVAATTSSPFAINLWTLSGTGPDVSGPAANFNQYADNAWNIGTFAGGITGFDSTLFSVVTDAANGTGGFANAFTGTFSIAAVGNALRIVYTAPIQSSYDYTGGSGSFSEPANWSLATIPAGTPAITFSGAGGTATNDLLAAVTGLGFTGSATGGYIVTGSGLAIGAGGVVNDSAFTQRIESPLTLTATGTVAANAGGLVLSGGVDTAGYGLTIGGAADTSMATVTGAGGLVKEGDGILTLSGSNAFTGGVTLAAGRIVAGDPLALGGPVNAVALNGGTLDLGAASVQVGALSGSAGGVVTTAMTAGTRTLSTQVTSGTSTYAGALRDNGAGLLGLVKSGSGTLVLSGSNSYSAGTTIVGGTLTVGHAAALGGSGNTLAVNAGTLDVGAFDVAVGGLSGSAGGVVTTAATAGTRTLTTTVAAGTSTYAGSLRDNGSGRLALVKSGTGTLTLSGSNTASGGLTVAAGTLQVGHAAAVSGTGIALAVNGGTLTTGTFNVSVGSLTGSAGGVITTAATGGTRTLTTTVASGTSVFAGTILNSGSGVLALTKAGAGTLVLTGSNGATGLTTVSAGTLQVGVGGTNGRLGGGAIANNAALVFNRSDNYGGPLANAISGTGAMQVLRGTLAVTGSVSITGPTTISGGVLQVGNGGTTGRLGSGAIVNNGAIVFNRTDGYGGTVTNAVSGTGSLTLVGGTLALGGNNSFTGDTRVAGGVLSLANTQALAQSTLNLYSLDSGVVALSAGTTATTYTLGGLSGSRNLTIGGNTLSVGGNNQSTTYAGSISGSGGLFKIGTGTLTLTGSSGPGGPTTISSGRLIATTANLTGTITTYGTLEFAQNTTGTFAGRVNPFTLPVGTVVKSGTGTLVVSGTINTNMMTVAGGRLVTGVGNLSESQLVNNATVEFNQATSGVLWRALTGTGALVKSGSGTLTLQSGGFTGTTTVSSGRLVAPATTLRGPIVNNAAFEFAQTSNGEYASVLSGSGSLTKSGSGTLTLSGSSLVTGLTTISAGMLATGGAERLADTSTVSISAAASLRLGGNETIGALLGSGSVNLQSYQLTIAGSGSSSYFGSIVGSGGLSKSGSGILTLGGTNGFLGATNLNMGTLVLSSSTALSPFTTLAIAAGSTLVVNRDVRVFAYTNSGGTISGSGRLLTSSTAATGGTLTSLADVSGTDAYAVGLLKTSTATLVVSGSTSFTGGVVVEQGTIKLDAGGSFASSNVVDVRSGATLDLNGQSQTVAALAGSGSVALGGGTLIVDASTPATFSGAIEGGALVKSGSSALNLTGSAAVSTASVSSGLMSVNGTLSGTVAVGPGGTLGGAGTIVGDVTVNGTHAPGNSPDISTIAGNLDYGVGATVIWEIGANTATQGPVGSRTFDQIVVNGNLTFTGSTSLVLSFFDQDPNSSWASTVDWNDEFWGTNHAWTLWQVSGTTTGIANLSLQAESWIDSNGAAFGTSLPSRSFSLAVSGNDVQLVYAVPEPTTFALAAAGIAASGLMLRRRRG